MQFFTIFNTTFYTMIFRSIVCRGKAADKAIWIAKQTSQKWNSLRFSTNSNSLLFFAVCQIIYLCLLNSRYRLVKLQWARFQFLIQELFKKKLHNETLEEDIPAIVEFRFGSLLGPTKNCTAFQTFLGNKWGDRNSLMSLVLAECWLQCCEMVGVTALLALGIFLNCCLHFS